MNPKYFGDSYDLVKRFFCRELSLLGYSVTVDPLPTGKWSASSVESYHRLIGADAKVSDREISKRTALFLDPDTGINQKGSKAHARFDLLAQEAAIYELVFAFDQSFSRQIKSENVMCEKLSALQSLGCYGMYYDSHARFIFVAKQRSVLSELRLRLLSVGLPESRLFIADV
jgi:hypothetical protein